VKGSRRICSLTRSSNIWALVRVPLILNFILSALWCWVVAVAAVGEAPKEGGGGRMVTSIARN
jgi:hypothetical protein